ncbi:hypothetical protein ACMD2_22858, partial [Ananas comosus]
SKKPIPKLFSIIHSSSKLQLSNAKDA